MRVFVKHFFLNGNVFLRNRYSCILSVFQNKISNLKFPCHSTHFTLSQRLSPTAWSLFSNKQNYVPHDCDILQNFFDTICKNLNLLYANRSFSNNSTRIQNVQNFSLRLTYGLRKYDYIYHKLIDEQWLNMFIHMDLHSSRNYRKVILFETPLYLDKKTYLGRI